jgi:hydroxyacylglutathione hydrolase
LITGFPAGMLACNCYVLAKRSGADAIIVDPGQRVMGPLRQILDENHLTPAAVLLTHGHVDHIWSAQKVADMYGCPAYIHPTTVHAHRSRTSGPRLADRVRRAVPRT